jgi:dolichol kinase
MGMEEIMGALVMFIVSRSGSRTELLKGPFYYGVVHVLSALIFWTETPTGLIAMITLCFGDGVADMAGRLVFTPFGGTSYYLI